MAAMAYEKTEVAVEKSQADIRKLLRDFGVMDMVFAEEGSAGTIRVAFRYDGKEVAFKISPEALLPDLIGAHKQTLHARLREQSQKIMWRQLYYYLKAALNAIRYRVRTFDDILLSAMVLPGGATLGERMAEHDLLPQLLAGQKCLPPANGA